jgi:RNA polymerase sigma-70 factor (ECF subfamily)
MTRDPDLAEDCVQDAFIRAWKALPKFESRSAFGTWLHRIAVNVVLEKRRAPTERELPVEDTAEFAEPLVLDSPLETAELEAVVASLPAGARDVLVLCGIYGYDHAEAAASNERLGRGRISARLVG